MFTFSTQRIAFIFLLAFFAVEPAYANIAYTVTPLVIDEEIEPRDIIEREITLTNTGDVPVTIYPTVNNIAVDEGGAMKEFITQVMSDQTTSLAAWIEISRAGIDLRAGEVKTINLTLRVNPGAKPGTYHAFVGFAHGGNRDEAERKVKQGTAPGIVVSTSLKDTKVTLLKLARFAISRFVVQEANTASSFTMRNPGDEPLVPHGEIIFYDSKGVEVGTTAVNPDNVVIPPGGEHEFQGTVPISGLFGKYKAFLSVEYGTQNRASLQDTAFFYAIPLRTLIIVLSLVLVCMLFVSLYLHRRYFGTEDDDGSEPLPLHIKDTASDPLHHDIDLRS